MSGKALDSNVNIFLTRLNTLTVSKPGSRFKVCTKMQLLAMAADFLHCDVGM